MKRKIPGYIYDQVTDRYFKDDGSFKDKSTIDSENDQEQDKKKKNRWRMNTGPSRHSHFTTSFIVERVNVNSASDESALYIQSSEFCLVKYYPSRKSLTVVEVGEKAESVIGLEVFDLYSQCYTLGKQTEFVAFLGKLPGSFENLPLAIYDLCSSRGVQAPLFPKNNRRRQRFDDDQYPLTVAVCSLSEYFAAYTGSIHRWKKDTGASFRLIQKISVISEPVASFYLQDSGLLVSLRNGSFCMLKEQSQQLHTLARIDFPVQNVINCPYDDILYLLSMNNDVYIFDLRLEIVKAALPIESHLQQRKRLDITRPPSMTLWMNRFLIKSVCKHRRDLVVYDLEKLTAEPTRISMQSLSDEIVHIFVSSGKVFVQDSLFRLNELKWNL